MEVTNDLQLVCRHEPNVNETTDALSKFPDRVTSHLIDGNNVTGIFVSDLTLSEIKSLRAKQPWPFRNSAWNGQYEVPTLDEFISVALAVPWPIGIYPETKHPTWHNSLPALRAANATIESLLAAALERRGYGGRRGSARWCRRPIFIQSFEISSLAAMRRLIEAPMILLTAGWPGYTAPDTGKTHEQMVCDEGLDEAARLVDGIGPWKGSLWTESAAGRLHSTGLVQRAHSRGLLVHPYTLRDEPQFVLPALGGDVESERELMFVGERVDGAFADYPGALRGWMQRRAQQQPASPWATPLAGANAQQHHHAAAPGGGACPAGPGDVGAS